MYRRLTGGLGQDGTFVETDDLVAEIDRAYQAKYGHSYPTIVPSIVRSEARAATLKLVPRTSTV